MKIWLMIGIIFFVLALMKLYIFNVLRHTFMFSEHKIVLALLLFGLYATELAFFFLAKDKGFDHTTYIALSSSVILAYSLFVACLVGDMSLRAGRFVLHTLDSSVKPKVESTKDSHRDFTRDSTLEAGTESMKAESTRIKSISVESSPTIDAQDTREKQDTHIQVQPILETRLDSSIESKVHSVLDSNRRRFLKIMFDLGIIALFFLFSFKSVRGALSIPKVRDVEVKIKGLVREVRIAMISDVHIGKMLQSDFVRGIVDKINALNADIVVIVGDLVDEDINFVREHLVLLNDLQSKEGVYYVSGNHEYYHGIDSILKFLKTLNLKVLDNANIELESVNLCGVSDLAGTTFNRYPPDIESAKQGRNLDKPSILLAHQPKFVRRNDVSDFDLVLCGHTHAGQVFPLSFFVWLDQHYVHGLYALDSKTQLYVSSGAGFWGPAMRFLAPSEIVNLTLKPYEDS